MSLTIARTVSTNVTDDTQLQPTSLAMAICHFHNISPAMTRARQLRCVRMSEVVRFFVDFSTYEDGTMIGTSSTHSKMANEEIKMIMSTTLNVADDDFFQPISLSMVVLRFGR